MLNTIADTNKLLKKHIAARLRLRNWDLSRQNGRSRKNGRMNWDGSTTITTEHDRGHEIGEIVNKFKFSTGEIGRSGKIIKKFKFLTGEIINKFKFLTGEIVKKFKFLTREIGNKFKFSKNIKERFRQTDEPPPTIVNKSG